MVVQAFYFIFSHIHCVECEKERSKEKKGLKGLRVESCREGLVSKREDESLEH